MNAWLAVILGSFAVYSWKLLGYLLPTKLLESKWLATFAGFLTIGLLAGLVGVQTFVSGQKIEFDARVPALIIAVVLLRFKAPFIVIVFSAATVAATLRLAF